MNRFALILIALLFFVCPSHSYAEEPIPRADFIKITDEIFDVLDEVETVMSNPESLKSIGKAALDKLQIVRKKYDRFIIDEWPKGSQQKIAAALFICSLSWDIVLVDWNAEALGKAREDTTKARQAYAAYRKKK